MPKFTIEVRHSKSCAFLSKGANHRKCECWKQFYINDNGKVSRPSTNTRSWAEAEREAQRERDRRDPDKAKALEIIAEAERRRISVEEAVCLFLKQKAAEVKDDRLTHSTYKLWLGLLGRPDETFTQIEKPGNFMRWIENFNANRPEHERITFLHHVQVAHVMSLRIEGFKGRRSAQAKSSTVRGKTGCLKTFFEWAMSSGYIPSNPFATAPSLKARRDERGDDGYEAGAFTDAQWEAIDKAIQEYPTDGMRMTLRTIFRQRLRAFVFAMRWLGCSIVDACLLQPSNFSSGVCKYKRQKTRQTAIIPIPEVVELVLPLLKHLPLEHNSDPAYYFATKKNGRAEHQWLHADTSMWRLRIEQVFKLAGVEAVALPGDRPPISPRPHMLRDTFAVGLFRQGFDLSQVAKMLGHAKTDTTRLYYLPWIDEVEKDFISKVRSTSKKLRQLALVASA